jgi:hypothetical protein
VARLLDRVVLAELRERGHQIRSVGQLRKLRGKFGAVAIDDAGDQFLFGREVDVERAGAHARFPANVLHGAAIEA